MWLGTVRVHPAWVLSVRQCSSLFDVTRRACRLTAALSIGLSASCGTADGLSPFSHLVAVCHSMAQGQLHATRVGLGHLMPCEV